jgi:hypothetical protein
VRNMEKLVHIAVAALFLLGIASAQNIPAIDVFGGYSYLSFNVPSNSVTAFSSERLALNGWDVSGSVRLLPHLAAEADFSGHNLSDCGGTTFKCSNFSYMFGPRFTLGRSLQMDHGLCTRPGGARPDESPTLYRAGRVRYVFGGSCGCWR